MYTVSIPVLSTEDADKVIIRLQLIPSLGIVKDAERVKTAICSGEP